MQMGETGGKERVDVSRNKEEEKKGSRKKRVDRDETQR